jgi:hypothetical protein
MSTDRLVREAPSAPSPARGPAAPWPRICQAAALAALILGLSGCGERDQLPDMTKQATKFDDVPSLVRDAARKAVPGVNFTEAWKNVDSKGAFHSYEIRGKSAADGKIREVRVSSSGEILEME